MYSAIGLKSLIGDKYDHFFDENGVGKNPYTPASGFYDNLMVAGKHLFRAMSQADSENAAHFTAAFGAYVRPLASLLYNSAPHSTAYNVCALLLLGYPPDTIMERMVAHSVKG